MMNIQELINSVEETDSTFTEIAVPAAELAIDENEMRCQGQRIELGQEGRDRVFANIDAPASYLRRLSPQVQTVVLNEVMGRGACGEMVSVVVRDSQVFNVSRGDLTRLPHRDVVTAMAEGLGDNAHTLALTRIVNDGDRLELELTSPRKSIDVRRGDVVQGGLHIVHRRFGDEATVVEKFIYRLVCKNGMTFRECPSQNGIVRTRKLAANHPNGAELQKEQIRRLTAQAWNSLEPQLNELRTTAVRPANVENLMIRWLQQARMSSRSMLPRLLSAWREEGSEETQYGAVNAITRVATHDLDLSQRQRRVLASLGGLLAFSKVHICPRCFSVLAGGEHSGTTVPDSLVAAEIA